MGKFAQADALRGLQRRDLERPPLPFHLPSPNQKSGSAHPRVFNPGEVEKLLQASSKVGRHGARDRTLILLAYRHLTSSLRWERTIHDLE